jgi:hypothetical protein
MVDLAEIQAAYYMVAATGVLVAAVYYILNLRVSQKNQELTLKALEQSAKAQQMTLDTRQAQLLMNLYQKMSDPDFEEAWVKIVFTWKWSDYEDFEAKYGAVSNPKKWRSLTYVGNYFEGVGILVKNGFLDAALVDDLMSSYLIRFWQKFGPIFKESRVKLGSPTIAEFMEYLYDAVYPIYLQQHPVIIGSISTP